MGRGVVGGYSMLRTKAGRKPARVIRTRPFPALQWFGGGVADDSFFEKRRQRPFPAISCWRVGVDSGYIGTLCRGFESHSHRATDAVAQLVEQKSPQGVSAIACSARLSLLALEA
jgi:hypothetical protein